jgi:hypothetical protein
VPPIRNNLKGIPSKKNMKFSDLEESFKPKRRRRKKREKKKA